MTAEKCANCDATLSGRFCAQCGQDTDAHRRAFGEMLEHAADQFFGLDGRILRTLFLLVARPGELTREFIAGRRQPYVAALRLYFFITVAFFVGLSLAGIAILQLLPYRPGVDAPGSYVSVSNNAGTVGTRPLWFRPLVRVTLDAEQRAALQRMKANLEAQGAVTSAMLGDHIVKLMMNAYADSAAFNAGVQAWMGRFLLLMMPLFALMTAALRPGRFLLVDHLTFALHFHSFLFIALAVVAATSFVATGAPLVFGALGAVAIYLFLSLRRAYGLGVFPALWRTGVLFVVYAAVFYYGFQFTILLTMSA